MMHIADNQNALLDYLYEEGDPADRLTIAKHLQECAVCSVAMLEMRTVRGMLTEWQPPAAQLGFRIVQDPDTSPRASLDPRARGGWWGWGPTTHQRRWAQAAAAVMLFVAGMAVSQLDVDYGDGALTVRTRSVAPAGTSRNASIQLPPSADTADVASRRIATEPAAATDTGTPRNAAGALRSETASTEQLLQRVRAMIGQSETRQQRELALRLSQVAGEVDTQHQADLLRIQQDFGQQQEMMDYLVRTAGGPK